MILVDTSVWIDFFSDNDTWQVQLLEKSISERDDLCICGIVLTEVLQGIRYERQYKKIKELFESLIFLEMPKNAFIVAAGIYRSLRKRGFTIRKSIDCMIAATALEHGVALLHNDRDFEPIEKHMKLRAVSKPS